MVLKLYHARQMYQIKYVIYLFKGSTELFTEPSKIIGYIIEKEHITHLVPIIGFLQLYSEPLKKRLSDVFYLVSVFCMEKRLFLLKPFFHLGGFFPIINAF
jgi:hypothetical protein